MDPSSSVREQGAGWRLQLIRRRISRIMKTRDKNEKENGVGRN